MEGGVEWTGSDGVATVDGANEGDLRMIAEQREEMRALKQYLKVLEQHMVSKRPISREQLPPIDGTSMQ